LIGQNIVLHHPDEIAYKVTASPETGDSGPTKVAHIRLTASRDGSVKKDWKVTFNQLQAGLSAILGQRRVSTFTDAMELGQPYPLPGNYSPHQLVQLGFRVDPKLKEKRR
jgi:hypothetical protein